MNIRANQLLLFTVMAKCINPLLTLSRCPIFRAELHLLNFPLTFLKSSKKDYTITNSSSSACYHQAPTEDDVAGLISFLNTKKKVCVITGAGVSTSSGIPDYRGPNGSYKLGHKPMFHQDFVNKEDARKRYWARSMLGWSIFSQARCNDAHYALARLETHGTISSLITQNVDRLHQKAGSKSVIDLHGRNDRVSCLNCCHNLSRNVVQQKIDQLNRTFRSRIHRELKREETPEDKLTNSSKQSEFLKTDWKRDSEDVKLKAQAQPVTPLPSTVLRADGDAELGVSDFSSFIVPNCPRCSTGVLKPDVVFFGDNVPISVKDEAFEAVKSSDGILVVGTSLEVFSAFKFVEWASKNSKQIAIVNMGATRADRQQLSGIVYRSESNCAVLLKAVADAIVKSS